MLTEEEVKDIVRFQNNWTCMKFLKNKYAYTNQGLLSKLLPSDSDVFFPCILKPCSYEKTCNTKIWNI